MSESAAAKHKSDKAQNVAYRGYKDGSVEFFSNHIEAMTGFTQEEFNAKQIMWTDIVADEFKSRNRQIFVQALKTDKSYSREYQIRKKDGSRLWIQEWAQIVSDDKGEVDYVLGILVDITEQKRLEDARLKCELRTGKYLTFALANQQFGISIRKIREIIGMQPITPIPNAPEALKGVINLRGKVIPVLEMRLQFGLESEDYTDRTCIIVVEAVQQDRTTLRGIVVDSVADVLFIKGSDIEDNPPYFEHMKTDFVLGMAKIDKRITILLDIDRILDKTSDMASLA